MRSRRIVITGMGLVSPLGCGVDAVWLRPIPNSGGEPSVDDGSTAVHPVPQPR